MNDFIASLLLMGALGGNGSLPFWMTSNQYGLYPEGSGAIAMVQAYSKPSMPLGNDFTYDWGISAGGNCGGGTCTFLVDELYATLGWKKLSLDLGMKHQPMDYLASGQMIGNTCTLGSLSSTGGHLVWSGNARTLPGYTLRLDPVAIPWTAHRLWVYGAWGDYMTYGPRYISDALIHSEKAFLRLDISKRISFHAGIDHYGVWGGSGKEIAKASFRNYLRLITGSAAGADGAGADQANVIGDQGGAELLKLEYSADAFTLTMQHEIPYNDKSGMRFGNFPDGINTLCFSFKDRDRWVSDILYEYSWTMYQSGSWSGEWWDPEKDGAMPEDIDNYGGDDYFNNINYWDGWTNKGRTIGYPLFLASQKDEEGRTWGVANNRLKAHHFALSGKLFRKYPYKLMLTYSLDYGTYMNPYTGESQWQKRWGTVKETPLHQFSAGFMGEVPMKKGFAMTYGLYADKGEVLSRQLGAMLGVRYNLCDRRK